MKHLRRLGNGISIRITPDQQGYTGRECPNPDCKGYFKIVFGTGLNGENLPCHCPYCGHTDKQDEFCTPDQIKYAKSVARQKVTKDIHKDLKALEFNHKPRGPFGIGISMKLKPGRLAPIHHYREKKLQTDVVCDNCILRYSVYGVFAFCPDCGQHNSLQILKNNLEIIKKILDLAENTEQELSARLIENALEDCVSAFDGFGRELCRVYEHHASNSENVNNIRFQNIEKAHARLQRAFGVDLTGSWGAEAEQVLRLFQKRHLIAHKMGVVDQEYLSRTADKSAIVGHKIVVSTVEVQQLANTISSAADTIYAEFQRLDNQSQYEDGYSDSDEFGDHG